MLAERSLFFDDFIRIAGRAETYELLRAVELTAKHRQHIHPRVRLTLEKHGDIVAVDLDTDSRFERRRVGLVRRLIEHGSEAEKLASCRLVDYDLLLIFIHDRHAHAAGNQDVSASARVSHFV